MGWDTPAHVARSRLRDGAALLSRELCTAPEELRLGNRIGIPYAKGDSRAAGETKRSAVAAPAVRAM